MEKSEVSELITEYRFDFVDQSKHPSLDDEDVSEYKELVERFHRRLSRYSVVDVRKMFESYIEAGNVFFPKVPAELLRFKPATIEDEQNIPDLIQTKAYIDEMRRQKAEIEKRLSDPKAREKYERAKREAQEKFETICREQNLANRKRKISFDFDDSEPDDH